MIHICWYVTVYHTCCYNEIEESKYSTPRLNEHFCAYRAKLLE